ETTAGAAGGRVDCTLAGDRCRNVRRAALRRLAVDPQELPAPGAHTDRAVLEELDVLFDAACLHNDRGRIGGLAAARHGGLPDHAAGLLVQRHQRRLTPAGRADESVAVDERRLRVGPLAGLPAE